jgi:hypothetical protein
MPRYDDVRFSPPAPVAEVLVRNPRTGAAEDAVPMLVDSGADVTLLPQRIAATLELDLGTAERYGLRSFEGTVGLSPSVQAELVLGNKTFRGQYLLIEDDCGILGRNVSNCMSLVLDGPRQEWNAK